MRFRITFCFIPVDENVLEKQWFSQLQLPDLWSSLVTGMDPSISGGQ